MTRWTQTLLPPTLVHQWSHDVASMCAVEKFGGGALGVRLLCMRSVPVEPWLFAITVYGDTLACIVQVAVGVDVGNDIGVIIPGMSVT